MLTVVVTASAADKETGCVPGVGQTCKTERVYRTTGWGGGRRMGLNGWAEDTTWDMDEVGGTSAVCLHIMNVISNIGTGTKLLYFHLS